MPPYRIELLSSAARALQKAPASVRHRLVRAIDRLGTEPRPTGAHKLRGADDTWRVRVGDYRILYEVQDEVLLVLVVKLGHRRDVYR